MTEADEPIACALTKEESYLLDRGLVEWGASARLTEQAARLIGFEDVAEFRQQQTRLCRALRSGSPMTRKDWTQVLLATEIAFASDVHGAGVEWSTVTGLDDVRSLEILRGLQRKLVAFRPADTA